MPFHRSVVHRSAACRSAACRSDARTLAKGVVFSWWRQVCKLAVVGGVFFQISNGLPCQAGARDTVAGARDTVAGDKRTIYFATDIVPILTKLQCNSGGCHGKATGQNGFKLSLLGFEPGVDYLSIARESQGRRIFPSAPHRSLLLRKASSQIPHGGGQRFTRDSEEYRTIYQWIANGARPPTDRDPMLASIDIEPLERVFTTRSMEQLQVTAHFSDGTLKDVTRQAVFESNQADVAEVDSRGLVRTTDKNGLFAVMVRYGGQIATFHGVIPFESDADKKNQVAVRLDALQNRIDDSPVNRQLLRQWRQLQIVPSEVADAATFIRRATIDICGSLPTREEVEAYVAETHPEKRATLIDKLLGRHEYASYFALKWAAILQNRGSGYSTNKQRAGTALFTGWIRDSIAMNKPYDQFVSEIITASGSQNYNPPAVWYRQVRTSVDYVESVAQAFLGVRIQCAQCHHHPFERWSQADYYGLAAVFSRVGRKGGFSDAEVPTNEIIYVKDHGDVFHPRTGEKVLPRGLAGPDFGLGQFEDPRKSFVHWMVDADNPFFAQTMVNRLWAHFHGRGIIEPIDDARSTNPPSNPKLLAALTRDFVDSGYDVKHLIRTICNSHSYQLEAQPNAWNRGDRQTFARFYPRRLSAEVLLDGMSQVLDVPTEFPGGPGAFPSGTRAIELPDENVSVNFLDVFGRPARSTACECERVDAPSLAQGLELVNSVEIQRKLVAETGYIQHLIHSDDTTHDKVTDIFLRTLARYPRSEEMMMSTKFVGSETDQTSAYRSLVWVLLATNEFLLNH